MKKINIFVFFLICIIFLFNFSSCILFEDIFYPTELGKNWEKIELPSYDSYISFEDIFYIFVSDDGKTMYAFGTEGSYSLNYFIFITEDYGNSWQKCLINPSNGFNLNGSIDEPGISFSSDGSTFYFFYFKSNSGYYLAKSTDKGKSFQIISENANFDDRVYCSPNGKIVLWKNKIYDENTSSYKISFYISYDYGDNFNNCTYNFPSSLDLSSIDSIKISDDGQYIIFNNENSLYISSDYGNNFTKSYETSSISSIRDFSVSDNFSNIYIASTNNYIIYSKDYGNSWKYEDKIRFSQWRSVDTSDDGKVIYVASNSGYIYKSTDSGESWQQITIFGKKNFTNIRCSSDGSKVLVSFPFNFDYSGLFRSDNFLNSATCCYFTDTKSFKDYIYNFISDDGLTMIFFAPSYNIMKTEDQGNSWKNCRQENFYDIKKVSSGNNLGLIALINDESIFISKDKAESWTEISGIVKSDWKDICVSADGNVIVIISSYKAIISRDSGNSWQPIDFDEDLERCWVSDFGDTIVILANKYIFIANEKTNLFKKVNINKSQEECLISSDGKIIVLYSSFYSNRIIFSKDAGENWIFYPAEWLENAAISKDGQILIGVEYYDNSGFGPYTGYIHRFYNFFENHTIFTNYDLINCYSLLISNDKSLVFIIHRYLNDNYIYVSLDQGENWARTKLNIDDEFYYCNILNNKLFLTNDNRKLILIGSAIYISNSN
jgi:photosystem II stability/assembly factor-like uncharacterized protein